MPELPPIAYTAIAIVIVFATVAWTVPQLVVSILGAVPKRKKRAYQKALDEARKRMGFRPGYGTHIEGERRGREVELNLETVEQGPADQDTRFFTECRIQLLQEPWTRGVVVRPRGIFGKIEKVALGDIADLGDERDIAIGDRRFDRDFLVAKRVSEKTKEALRDQTLQTILRDLASGVDYYEIRISELRIEINRGFENADELVRIVDRSIDQARALDDAAMGRGVSSDDSELFPDLI